MNPRSLPPCAPSSVFASSARLYRQAGPAAYSRGTACRCSLELSRSRAAVRPLHSSRRLFQDGPFAADGQSHYDTLNVPFGAPVADIKKSFYKLSKVHHPDHNPKDPSAPRRFMRISEAYAVLSHADKRAVYDRDVMRHHQQQQQHRPHGPHRANASYHSTGPAGGRPASGLSRRRSAFRGPPPSFYRNTGAGKSSPHTPGGEAPGAGHSAGPQYGPAGSGPGNVNAKDTGTRSSPRTPHFDWDKTERSHRNVNERIAERRAAAAHGASFQDEPSMVVGFLIMSAALTAGLLVPIVFFTDWRRSSRTTPKADAGG